MARRVILQKSALLVKLTVLMMIIFLLIPFAVMLCLGTMVRLVMLLRSAREMITTALLMDTFLHQLSVVLMLIFAMFLKIVMEFQVLALWMFVMISLTPTSVPRLSISAQ
jgi:hypothetical protein